MKYHTISETTSTVVYKTKKIQIDRFTLTESYINNLLTSQLWSVEGGFSKTHPSAYEPDRMIFKYYPDTSFLESECNFNSTYFFCEMSDHSLIENINELITLDNIICLQDGCIYKITEPEPVPMWRHFNYIEGGFTNKIYDLKKVSSALSKLDFVRNIKEIQIPYYHQYDGNFSSVEFDYKLPSRQHLRKILSKIPLFKKHHFV